MDNKSSKMVIIATAVVCGCCVIFVACSGAITLVYFLNQEAIDNANRSPLEAKMVKLVKEHHAKVGEINPAFGEIAIGVVVSDLERTVIPPRSTYQSVVERYVMKGKYKDSQSKRTLYFVAFFSVEDGEPKMRSFENSSQDIRNR